MDTGAIADEVESGLMTAKNRLEALSLLVLAQSVQGIHTRRAKIEAGKLEFETIDFDLRNVVEESLELVANQAVVKKLELVSLVSAKIPTAVRGDPGRQL